MLRGVAAQRCAVGRLAAFWSHVTTNGECWRWTGAVGRDGYGAFRWQGRVQKAHRISWMLAHLVPVPAGQLIRHRCNNRRCVRPAHLTTGTHADNRQDMLDAGRQRMPGARLSKVDRDALHRELLAGQSVLELARRYGLTRTTLHRQRARLLAGGAT